MSDLDESPQQSKTAAEEEEKEKKANSYQIYFVLLST